MTVHHPQDDPPGLQSDDNGDLSNPKPKTYANVVDDLKRVTMDEVTKFEEEYIRDEKKWESTLNIPKNDHEVRKSYLQQITRMRNVEKKSEIRYKILKFKVTEIIESDTKALDSTTMEWAKRAATKKTVMKMLGNENWTKMSDGRKLRKNAAQGEGGSLKGMEAKTKEYIVTTGEFVIGDMVYIPFNQAFNPALKMDLDQIKDIKVAGKKWKIELMDQEDVMRGEGAKCITVRLENAASRFSEEDVKFWCEDFGTIIEIRKVDPNKENTRHLLRKAIDEGELTEEDSVIFDEIYDDMLFTARDYELKMTLKKNFPTILPMADVRIRASHEKQIPQCLNCFRQGHLASYCANQKIDYGTYSLFANLKWGTEDHKEIVRETRLREVINHKKLVMNEFRKGKRLDTIKPKTRIGKVAQKRVQEMVKERMNNKLAKKKDDKELNDKCWNLRDKIARLNNTETTMLTEKGKEMLNFAKNGLKNLEKFPSLIFPVQMSELSYAQMDSCECIEMEEIETILDDWNCFQLEASSFVRIGNKRFPNRF